MSEYAVRLRRTTTDVHYVSADSPELAAELAVEHAERRDREGAIFEALQTSGPGEDLPDDWEESEPSAPAIGATLTQISNTLARTLDREQTRFITVTLKAWPGEMGKLAESEPYLIGVHSIEGVSPRYWGAQIHTAANGVLDVTESLDEITTMINAGAYVPPF